MPIIGESIPTVPPVPGKINVNIASTGELQTLSGIGKEKAGAIVAFREQNGLFSRTEDLLLVPGIGPKTLENLSELITVR